MDGLVRTEYQPEQDQNIEENLEISVYICMQQIGLL